MVDELLGNLPDGVDGQSAERLWREGADIETLLSIMDAYGMQPLGRLQQQLPRGNGVPMCRNSSGMTYACHTDYGNRYDKCQYSEDCYDPVGEYVSITIDPWFVGGSIIRDDFGNIYLNIHGTSSPGGGITVGNIILKDENGNRINIEELSVDLQEQAIQDFLTGWGSSSCGSAGATACYGRSSGNEAVEGGFSVPGVSTNVGFTFIVVDR